MAWSTIRRATDEDRSALDAAAQRFCERHGIDTEGGAQLSINCALSPGSGCGHEAEACARRLRPLWARIVRRVLGEKAAEGIAYGYVGYHAE